MSHHQRSLNHRSPFHKLKYGHLLLIYLLIFFLVSLYIFSKTAHPLTIHTDEQPVEQTCDHRNNDNGDDGNDIVTHSRQHTSTQHDDTQMMKKYHSSDHHKFFRTQTNEVISEPYPSLKPLTESMSLSSEPSSSSSSSVPGTVLHKYFLAAIFSTCDEKGYERRRVIRKWMDQYRHSNASLVDFVFLLSDTVYGKDGEIKDDCRQKLRSEQTKFGDLLFMKLKSSEVGWANLTKKLEKMIRFMGDFNLFHKYRYIIKIDDDSILKYDEYKNVLTKEVDQPYLKAQAPSLLPNQDPKTELSQEAHQYLGDKLLAYSGYFRRDVPVRRWTIWKDIRYSDDIALPHYPQYATGAAYVFSSGLGQLVYSLSKVSRLEKWSNEDATFGHWLSTFDHTPHNANDRFSLKELPHCNPNSVGYHPIKEVKRMDAMVNAFFQGNSKLACLLMQGKVNRFGHGTNYKKI